jgi:hypothetical protein
MLRSLKDLRGYTIVASDGDIGTVDDFFFDEEGLTVRYLVVDTGTWLPGRRVLIPAVVAGRPSSWTHREVPVTLSREQVEDAPGVDFDEPVSRRRERELHEHYGWRMYWLEPADPAAAHTELMAEIAGPEQHDDGESDEEASHLRSARTVEGYAIAASDGGIGHVEDFVAEVETWVIRYMVVDTRNWLPGRKVLIAPPWISDISWERRQVAVDLPRETIENGPEFDPSQPVNRELETRLYDFYGRPKYWV